MTLSSRRSVDDPVGGSSSVAVCCPFPAAVSPYEPALHRYATTWATRHGLLPTAHDVAVFDRARFAGLMARAYPYASPADLSLAVAWLTVTFALDDHLESVLGRAPAAQRDLAAQILAYLRGGPPARALDRPLAAALADVWTRTRARTAAGWRERFIRHVAAYLAGNADEADNRLAGRIPGVAEYVRLRRHTAATALFFDLAEVLGPAPAAAADPYAEAALSLLRQHADNVVAWFNDLVSWPKEVAGGDPHNLVLVVRHEHRSTLAEAVAYVVARHDREVGAFVAAASELRDRRPDLDRSISALEH